MVGVARGVSDDGGRGFARTVTPVHADGGASGQGRVRYAVVVIGAVGANSVTRNLRAGGREVTQREGDGSVSGGASAGVASQLPIPLNQRGVIEVLASHIPVGAHNP